VAAGVFRLLNVRYWAALLAEIHPGETLLDDVMNFQGLAGTQAPELRRHGGGGADASGRA